MSLATMEPATSRRSLIGLALCLVLVAGVASLSALFMPGDWFRALIKPPLNPPDWVFAPVWTTLYICIAIAGWLIWRTSAAGRSAFTLWTVQLLLNAAWSPLFFGMERADLALLDIIPMLIVIIATIVVGMRLRPLAAWLLVPYAAWVSFASYLNAAIWYLNR